MAGAQSIIVVDNLIKAYEGRNDLALKGISLDVKKGECFGLLGPNGAGKTTLMGCLLGLLNPDGGKLTIAGLDPNDYAVREVIGFLPERPHFESWLTASEFLAYHHALSGRPKRNRKEEVKEALTRVGLQEDAWDRRTNKYSRGMLQRLGLAQALIGNPDIVFLDEPGSGMDPPGVAILREILLDLKRRQATVILNSHHLDEMERVCDRVAFIKNGQILALRSMSSETDYPHVLRIKFATPIPVEDVNSALTAVAQQSGASIIEADTKGARLMVKNGHTASLVIKHCVEENIQLQSASPESTSLEHLFKEITEIPTNDNEHDDLSNHHKESTEE